MCIRDSCWASLLPPRLVGMAGDAGNRLETTDQDTAFYITTLVLPRWLTLSFCPENIKKTDLKTSANHEKTILGALWDTPGRVSGSHLGPKDEKSSKKDEKGSPLETPFGIHWGSIFHHFNRKSNFLEFFFATFFWTSFFMDFGRPGDVIFRDFDHYFSIFFELFLHILRIVKTRQTAVTSFQNGVRPFLNFIKIAIKI